jgi:hypothetical protein
MADTYQLMDAATRVGYSIESSNGVDPLAGGTGDRIRWPGPVLNVPSLSEDYMHQDYQPLGSGPDPSLVAKRGEQFEVEVESLLAENFIGANELISLSLGTINASTGAVTMRSSALRTFTLEWGWKSKLAQSTTITLSGVEAAGTSYTITINGVDIVTASVAATFTLVIDAIETELGKIIYIPYTGLATSKFIVGETVTETTSSATGTVLGDLRTTSTTGTLLIYEDSLDTFTGGETLTGSTSTATATGAAGAPADGFTVAKSSPTFSITSAVAGLPYTVAVTQVSTMLMEVTAQANTSWFHKLLGCKINTVTFTLRPDDLILMRLAIIGRLHVGSQAETWTQGDEILDLVAHTTPPAHHSHATYTLQKQSGDAINTIIKELDLTWTNNLDRIFSDNQNYYASHLAEGNRRFTFNMTLAKQDNDLLEISRGDPTASAGKLDFQVVISQTSGFYLNVDMPTCVLAERSADLGSDITHVDESFAGLAVGTPVVDLKV